ncbi:MAG: NAD(+)/NADH kinase [Acidimicrobiia bacterium]|nr:NAD(+)/NADH kinase [Acidimicrobiia bacterium]
MMKSVELVVHDSRPDALEFAEKFSDQLEAAGISTSGDPDVVMALGGDGTMLAAVQRAIDLDIPVLGFNLGTIGFLSSVDVSDVDRVIEALSSNDFLVSERSILHAKTKKGKAMGLNDVVVEKIDSQRLVQLRVSIDDEPFLTYRCDGLIAATPTGSTAYTFSSGGPLVDPEVEAILLSPVAAHSLFDRTMVLPANRTLKIIVERDRPVRVSVDKVDLGVLEEGDSVEVRTAAVTVRFLALDVTSFPQSVTEKFGLAGL